MSTVNIDMAVIEMNTVASVMSQWLQYGWSESLLSLLMNASQLKSVSNWSKLKMGKGNPLILTAK